MLFAALQLRARPSIQRGSLGYLINYSQSIIFKEPNLEILI